MEPASRGRHGARGQGWRGVHLPADRNDLAERLPRSVMLMRNRTRFAVAVAALTPALALTGCGGSSLLIDPTHTEQLIRQDVKSDFKVKSVTCPDNITPKAGGSFNCQISVTSVSDGSVHSGTVTIHMDDAKGHVSFAPSDFHVT
jgi:hypothetical protein